MFSFRVVFKWNLNHTAFMSVLLDLIRAGNIERAVKLCAAVPTALVPWLLHPILVLAGSSHLEDPLAELAFVARGALEQAEARVRRWTRVGLLAGVVLVGAVLYGALHWSREEPAGWALLALALLLLAHAGRRLQQLLDVVRSAPVEVIAALLPQLDGPDVSPREIAAAIVAAPGGGGS